MGKSTKGQKQEAAAIMQQAIMRLKQKCPGLIGAINMLKCKPSEEIEKGISSDGEYLYYNPKNICNIKWVRGYSEIMRDILHIICHGLFGHLDMHVLYRDRKLMWVAMDREVEYYVNLLLEGPGEAYWFMDDYLGKDYSLGCYYTARNNKAIRSKMLKDRLNVERDDHRWWINSKQAWKEMVLSLTDGGKMDIRDAIFYMGGEKNGGFGSESLGAAETIKAADPNHRSYYDTLLEFLKPNEVVKEEPDSIDPMLYHYGLDMYGDVPLIEPMETEHFQALNTICIAIDTSGSCSDEVAEIFLRETGNVLKDLKKVSKEGEVCMDLRL